MIPTIHASPPPALFDDDNTDVAWRWNGSQWHASIPTVFKALKRMFPEWHIASLKRLALYVLRFGGSWLRGPATLTQDLADYLPWLAEAAGEPHGEAFTEDTCTCILGLGRCGHIDHDARRKHGLSPVWLIQDDAIEYHINKVMGHADLNNAGTLIAVALSEWAKVTDMTFRRVEKRTDRSVRFWMMSELDKLQGDAPQTLYSVETYHQPYAKWGADVALYLSHAWAVLGRDDRASSLACVQHSAGHALGLPHINTADAWLNPFHHESHLPLTAADVLTAQAFYVPAESTDAQEPAQEPAQESDTGTITTDTDTDTTTTTTTGETDADAHNT
jgi:hypothetical protein